MGTWNLFDVSQLMKMTSTERSNTVSSKLSNSHFKYWTRFVQFLSYIIRIQLKMSEIFAIFEIRRPVFFISTTKGDLNLGICKSGLVKYLNLGIRNALNSIKTFLVEPKFRYPFLLLLNLGQGCFKYPANVFNPANAFGN